MRIALALLGCLVVAAHARADERAARRHYERGQALFRTEHYEDARTEFEASWNEQHTSRALYALGHCERLMRHYAEAVMDYERYLAMIGDDASADPPASAVRDEIDHLRHLVGRYALTITPDGAHVSIDGHALGDAPITQSVWLDAGHHVLTVEHDGFGIVQRNLDVAPDADEQLTIALNETHDPAFLVVSAEPQVIDVMLDGLPWGQTPEGRDVAPGTHHLRFFRPGYLSQEDDIVLAPGQRRRMHVGLVEDVVWNHWLFWTLIAAAVVGAGIALAVVLWPQPQIGGNLDPPIVQALSW